jgi:hypothetical protein
MTEGNGTREQIGEHRADIRNIKKRLDEIETTLKSIELTLAMARGGWKTLVLISGVSATVGGAVAKLVPFLSIVR